MSEQNYKNHRQLIFTYHILTLVAIIVLLAGAVRNIIYCSSENLFSAYLIFLVALIILSLYLHSRSFALKAQDRAIRAEESLRYFLLTGKSPDQRLTISQFIALRFASDEEMPSLAKRAAEEGLTNDAIKKAIREWKADNHRA